MSRKNYDYRKKMRTNQIKRFSRTKKVVASVALTSAIVASPLSFNLVDQSSYKNVLSTNTVSAASLVDVQLFENVNITANLTENEIYPHNLALDMTSTSLVNLELVSPERVALFDASELAGKLEKDGLATVQVEILPITMDDVPALGTALEGVQGVITGLVSTLLSDILQHPLVTSNPLVSVEIEGLDHLEDAVANLTDLNHILTTVLEDYTDTVDYTINSDGTIVVEYTDGLGNHLEGLIQDAVAQAVSDVNDALNNLEVKASGLIGSLLDPIINGVANDLLLPFVGEVGTIVDGLVG